MSLFPGLKEALLQKRTNYVAFNEGKEITGCGDCGNNHTFPGLLPFAPTHKCIIATDDKGQMAVIYDPFNIPEYCPIKKEKV